MRFKLGLCTCFALLLCGSLLVCANEAGKRTVDDKTVETLNKLLDKVRSVVNQNSDLKKANTGLSVGLDTEVNRKDKSDRFILFVGWWFPGDAKAATMKEIADAQRDFFNKIKASLSPEEIALVEVHEMPPPTPETRKALLEELQRVRRNLATAAGESKRRRRRRLSSAPVTVAPGQFQRECSDQNTHGTVGAILQNSDKSQYYVLTNDHVFAYHPNGDCKSHGKDVQAVSYAATPGEQESQMLTYGPKNPAKGFYKFKAKTGKQAWDLATMPLASGIKASCKSNGVQIAGEAGGTTSKVWTKDGRLSKDLLEFMFQDSGLWKKGARTGVTKGKVVRVAPYQDNDFWGLLLTGTEPDFTACTNCKSYDSIRSGGYDATVVNNRNSALAKGWDSQTVFSAGGDSGSLVLDKNNKAFCLLNAGTWDTHTVPDPTDNKKTITVARKLTYCMPWQAVLETVNAQFKTDGEKEVSLCVDANDVTQS